MKILAVDDDPLLLDVLHRLLGGIGYSDVVLAEGVEEALQHVAAQTIPFECVLLDIQMPGMDGIALCDKLRRNPLYRDCPIIMVTAMHDKGYVDTAFAAGASDYVTKPFDVADLGIRIRRAHRDLLERRQQRAQEMQAPFALDGVAGALSSGAFEEHLSALGGAERRASCVFALRLDDLRDVQAVLSPRDFRQLVTGVAECIGAELGGGYALAYTGNGRFACLRHGAELIDPEAFGARLQARLDSVVDTILPGAQPDLHVTVGPPMRPRMSVSGGARALVARILERVDEPRSATPDYPHPKPRRALNQ
ncbi:MAG: response regulator [Tranquillimonas sp.]